MKRLMILGAVWALAVARPEQYKEKEDFQYSRSSSDDGTKSGYYGAQRGNMGGNYERAHNMDSLAQNQMSGLVKQVEGELGDGANTRAGSVYTAANSRGTYGSGHFDLSNLAGRNFQEGETYGSSASHQSSSSAYNAAAYNSRSHSSSASGYQAGHSGLNVHSDDLQSLDNTQGTYGYGRQSTHSAGYNAQSGYQQHTGFDTSNTNALSGGYGSNVHTRLISATPVRIVGRPGMRVAIPIAAQTYDITHGSSLMDQNSLNSEAEVLNADTQHTVYRPAAKHYESSFNYRKQWEKHDTIPSTVFVPVPATSTENPFPKNSELYEDSQAHTGSHQYDARLVDSQRAQSSNVYSGYDANVKSTSGQSRLNYNTQHTGASTHGVANAYTVAGYNRGSSHHDASADVSSSGYNTQSQYNAGRYQGHAAVEDASSLLQAAQNSGYSTDLNSQVENLNSKPKSYHSSYSYHKSWERQGDPYVIKPASAGYYDASAQRLTAGTASGSHYQHSHSSGADCDENGHIRVARSYNPDQFQDMQQHSQNLEDLGQQVEDLGQQTQALWGQGEDGQQVQRTWDNLEDLSQQSHNKWDELQQTWDKFEDMGQKPQDVNSQISNLEQNNQNDLGRRQETATELKDKKQDQESLNQWDVTSQTQEEKENIHSQHHEQSNVFDQQVNQPGMTEDDIFSQYLQTSNKPHNQFSIWDKLDMGSFQNVQQNKKENDSSNGQQTTSGVTSQHRDLDLLPVNTANDADLTQSEHHNVNYNSGDESVWQHFSADAQQSHKLPEIIINLPSNSGHYIHSQHQFNQNQLQKDENSFHQSHTYHENYNWNSFSSSHRQEQTTNTENLAHVNAFGANSQSSPLSSIWDKLDNVEQFKKEDNSEVGHQINEKDSKENNENSPKTSKETSSDAGRGDIGPEVVSDSKPYQHSIDTPVNVETIQTNNKKPTKEIETDLPDHVLSVLGLHEQKATDQNKQNELSATNTNKTLIQNNYQGIQRHENEDWSNLQTSNVNLQQNSNHFGHHVSNEQNKDFENLHQQSQQHNKTELHNLFAFGQHGNEDQQVNLQDFGQQANLDQQNLQDFGQQANLEQQNLQDFGQQANLDQQNLQDFGQQANLDQQNLQDFGHQANLEQQNLHDFGQQANLEQQNLQDFGQHENLEQQNLQDFGQQANLEQQNLQDFGQHENLEQQNVHDFGQQANLEQQNLQDFGQHENMEQTNLQDFGQQANLEQQNLQDFGQQANLEQQNLQDFGQHENLEQQNLQDFGQHENLEQQNLQDFGQHENLEQQNLQDFGQQAYLEQQNLQGFSQQENLEQENLQDFGQHMDLQQHLQNGRSQYTPPELKNQNLEKSTPDKHEQPATIPKNNVQSQSYIPPPNGEVEEIIVKKQKNDLQAPSAQNPGAEIAPKVEPVTEKPGFWKNIGNKLSKAKTKIASWF
uniref:Uncharacterized protein n=1 Tax=Heliothis virescens TaxID=7102 RepID=A0A2A4IWU4_HELVI